MKAAELRQLTTCGICEGKVLATGLPLFWRVTIERFGVDVRAVQRQDGLGQFLGSHPLAAVMGPDEDMASAVMDKVTMAVCESCACGSSVPIAVLGLESAAAKRVHEEPAG